MDDQIQVELDAMMKVGGLERYGQLMAAKFGGDAEQYKPYLLAVGLELGYIRVAVVLDSIEDEASLLLAKMRNDAQQPLLIAAGEAVGIDWPTRSAEIAGKPSEPDILEVVE